MNLEEKNFIKHKKTNSVKRVNFPVFRRLKIMDNKMLEDIKFLINILLVFILFLFISYFIPLTGDDWTNASFQTNNIFKIIKIAFDKYFIHEGRVASRVFVLFFCNTKWIWNFANAFMVSTVCFIATKLVNSKRPNFISLLFILSILFVENTMFTQTYLWVTGNMTYYLPMFLVLIYLYLIDKVWKNNFTFNKVQILIIILLNILIPTMVEHISVTLVVTNIFLIIYSYLKQKKPNYLFLITTIISITGFLIIYLSPGAMIRAAELEFSNYSIFKKISINIPNFINYTYIQNPMLMLLLIVLFSTIIYRYNINKFYKFSLIFVSTIIPFLTFLYKCLGLIANKSSKAIYYIIDKIAFVMNINNNLIIIFWLLITIALLIINIFCLKKFRSYKSLFIFIVGIIANIAMLLSPIWGGRTALFTLVFLYIDILMILEFLELKINYKLITKFLYLIFFIYIIILLVLYHSVHLQKLERERSIKAQLSNNLEAISIERFPDNILWNSNAYNKFHEGSLRKYYNIPKNVVINREKVYYKYKLIYYKLFS